MTTFDDIEIENSKKRLFDFCADETSSRFRRRQGPKKSFVNIDDMMCLLLEKGNVRPVFVARDLTRQYPTLSKWYTVIIFSDINLCY